MNSFGEALKVTTFGESHGKAIGCIVDGVPAGIELCEEEIQKELDRRKPGQNKFSTPRKESDTVEILSGVFEGVTTGTPIGLLIRNENQKSKDYSAIKDIFRPGHADFTYFKKYGLRDYRGGGRSSARETAARVAAGAVAKKLLAQIGVEVKSGVFAVGGSDAEQENYEFAKESEIYALDAKKENIWKEKIESARKSHDSIGAVAKVRAFSVPVGLGEPLYHKLDSIIAKEMMGINGVKAVEIGDGIKASTLKGSENNDSMDKNGFKTNHSGGILGGISNGEDVEVKVYFKPTPSIFIPQQTQDVNENEVTCNIKGRHDPCIGVRGSVVAEMMLNLVLADLALLNLRSDIKNIKDFYENR